MNLTDILREIEDEENGQKSLKISYDLAVQPESMEDALNALNNIDNYGIYAQNMRDPKAIAKAFGPSIPAQKAGAAWKDWDSRSDEEKEFKIIDIKNREPEAWKETETKSADAYDKWQSEGNEGTFEDYLKSLPGKSLPLTFYGKYGKNYFPMKTPANLKKYAGKLEKDVNYKVEGDKIIFPSELENPFNTKAYLEKVLKTVFNNAKVNYDVLKIEPTGGSSTDQPTVKPKAEEVPPLSTTVNTADQADKLRKLLQNKLGDVPSAKFEVEPVGDGADRKYKLIVTGITASQRAALQPIAFDYKTRLKESDDLEMRQLLVRAGIIK
jgi:hypothetical protein